MQPGNLQSLFRGTELEIQEERNASKGLDLASSLRTDMSNSKAESVVLGGSKGREAR